MSFLKRKLSKKDQILAERRLRWALDKPLHQRFLNSGEILFAIGFFLYAAALVFLCFYGQSPSGLGLSARQIAKTRIVAKCSFSYASKLQQALLIEERCQQIAPCYGLTMGPYETFRQKILVFQEALTELHRELTLAPNPQHQIALMQDFTRVQSSKLELNLHPADIEAMLALTPEKRAQALHEGLLDLQEILQKGILDLKQTNLEINSNRPHFFCIQIENAHGNSAVQSEEEGLIDLRRQLRVIEIEPKALNALYRLLKSGLVPNLKYDPLATAHKIEETVANIEDVIIHVNAGEILAEAGTVITDEQAERLHAYRYQLKLYQDAGQVISPEFVEDMICTLAMLLIGIVYIRLALPELQNSSRKTVLCALLLLINVAILRIILEIDEAYWGEQASLWSVYLPFIAPIAFGPMIATLMIGPTPAIILALLVSVFSDLMQSAGMAIFLVYFLSALLGIYATAGARARSKVIRAGVITGVIMALGAIVLSFDELENSAVIHQALIGLATGFFASIGVVGLLPLLEHLFKITTDITLLELTDYNHPILRRLQLICPGTYHHSLMVANLAEQAASQIGANPLVCRACALYHDIGKMVKPEYFVENQQDGLNPHIERTPSMSALVIKNHVKEGVQIGKQAKLPKVIIDIIEQHHGTSLIQYFYAKARQRKRILGEQNTLTSVEDEEVDETTYRYDGPKPCFKESAIISLADPLEAASRALRKITPQRIDELIERVFQERIEDRQLDNCPLTMHELHILKKAFSFSLLNMLHSRTEYPGAAIIPEDSGL